MRDEPGLSLTPYGYARNASAREHIARDLAADVVALLQSEAEIERRSEAGETIGRDPVRPGHLAVLVRTNQHAALIRDALDEAGVPAVINGAGSVFGTEPARDWLRLLEALERPASAARARSAALTAFLGWDARAPGRRRGRRPGVGGRAPAAARLGAGAAPARAWRRCSRRSR